MDAPAVTACAPRFQAVLGDPLGPGVIPNRTYDVVPHAESADYDDSGWRTITGPETELRLSQGRVCFGWYRIAVTIPEQVGGTDPAGASVVFEVAVDDCAEIWVNGELPHTLGDTGGPVVAGFNAPNRVLLTRDAHPGQRFVIAVFGINDPISASPRNYIWLRTATLDFYTAQRARVTAPAELVIERANPRLDAIITADATLERIAGGFESTAGPVWSRDGSLLFSSPAMNTIYRWQPTGQVTVFRPKSGYSGVDIGRYPRPGSNGLALDPQARLTICELGNRRVVRIEPHGNLTVLAGRFDGRRLNGPADLVYRTDGTLFFTDPASDLPERSGDPGRELPFSGVFAVRDGQVTLMTGELEGPGGLAFSPDERHLYVGNCERGRQVVMRYELGAAGHEVVEAGVLADLTGAGGENAIGGLTVDQAGHVYVCGPGGIWVISPAGEHLGTVRLPEAPANLTWGDSDAQTLYITAVTSVYRVRLHIPGSHVH